MADKSYDVVIIGGGPAGASCALYTARARLSTLIIDRSASAGALAIASKIANYPGVKGSIHGAELLEVMREQAADFGTEFIKSTVVGVDFRMEPKIIYTPEETYTGRAVVIATGSMGRKDRLPGEEKFLGRGVSYCATCDAAFFVDQEVAIVGDTDIAIEECLFLTRFARLVHLIVPRSELKGWSELIDSVRENPKVSIHLGTRLEEIMGTDSVDSVRVSDTAGAMEIIPVSGVFVLLSGNAPTTDYLGGAVPLTTEGCVAVDDEKTTVMPGVYAIGDVTCAHIKQAAVAAADGIIAALAIDKYLNMRERVRADYK